jgi:alanyl-tRNA synthetase
MAGILGKVSERANGYHSLEVFVDCLYTSLALILQDVQLSQTKDGHLLKRYLKLVLIHCERIGLDQSDLYPLLQSAIEGLCENSDVQQIISLYQLNLSNVKASMDQNRANFLKFRKRNSAMKREDLLNIAVSRFGILPIEAADWLEQVY